jgi:hypothetical protein
MIDTVFFIPVAAKDATRVQYAVRSIRKYSERHRIYLLLDGLDPSALAAELIAPDISLRIASPASGGNWGKIWLFQVRTMAEASRDPEVAPQALFIRMDSDALVIRRGFAERARKLFSTRPKAGQIGQTFSNVRGARFPNAGWVNYLRKMLGWRGLRQFVTMAVREKEGVLVGLKAYRDFRRIVREATANGYVLGDICLGCFNVMRRELVAAMADRICLETSPFRYLAIMGDDISMTLHVYWLGFAPIDDAADDGLCGIEVGKFRVDPFMLKARGHYALHPIKYGYSGPDRTWSEAELAEALLED